MQQFVTSYKETPDVFPSVVSNDTKVLQLFISLSLATYKNCGELYKAGKRNNDVYSIDPDNTGAFDVYCDQKSAGGGWTVFQKRLDGSVDFYRGWDDYKRGFGNLNG